MATLAAQDALEKEPPVRVAAGDREHREHLCRNSGWPALAESRSSRLPDEEAP